MNVLADIVQCASCNIHLYEKEYLRFHKNVCHEKYFGKPSLVELVAESIENESSIPNNSDNTETLVQKIAQANEAEPIIPNNSEITQELEQEVAQANGAKPSIPNTFKDTRKLVENAARSKKVPNNRGNIRSLPIKANEERYNCSTCSYTTKSRTVYNRHVLTHQNYRPFACQICDKAFGRKEHLRRHILIHKTENVFACEYCSFKCRHETYLARHVRTTHRNDRTKLKVGSFECKICDKVIKHRSNLSRHVLLHGRPKNLTCQKWDCRRDNKKTVAAHGKNVHGEDDGRQAKGYGCLICNKYFSQKSYLKVHILVHSGVKPFHCSQCDYESGRSGNLTRHVNTVHQKAKGASKRHKCNRCEYETNTKQHFEQHVNMHEGVRPYRCETCSRRFANKTKLNTHVLRHTGEKLYDCASCGYKSNYKQDLRLHVIDKHNETGKRFTCTDCPYETNYKSAFNRHTDMHDGVKAYECFVCGRRFAEKSNLKKHCSTKSHSAGKCGTIGGKPTFKRGGRRGGRGKTAAK